MKIWTPRHLQNFCIYIFLAFATVPAFAGCIDLTKGNSFSLVRNEPRFEVINTVSEDGSVTEEREMSRNGSIQKLTTTYWNGVIAVDRKSPSSHIQLKLSKNAKLADLRVIGKKYSFPVSILVNGNKIDSGSFTLKTIKKTTLDVGGCNYRVMVVRTSLERDNGDPINEEALLSLDVGMLLGNVAMTPDWQAKHGVFFDNIKAN